MKKAGIKDAILQQSRFEEGQKHFSAGLINYEDWAITQARINYAILEILPQQVPETTTAPIPRDQIKKLTEAGQLEAALRLLIPAKPFDGTLVLARIKTAEKNYKLGLIDAANLDRIRGQVSFAILEMSK